jgi:hypothetical protein
MDLQGDMAFSRSPAFIRVSAYSGSGSIEADIAPLQRASSRSAPKAWI